MAFTLDKFEKLGLCNCCLQNNSCKRLWNEYYLEGEPQIYGKLLLDCFVLTHEYDEHTHICDTCITKLRAAAQFKKQVISAAEQLIKLKSTKIHTNLGHERFEPSGDHECYILIKEDTGDEELEENIKMFNDVKVETKVLEVVEDNEFREHENCEPVGDDPATEDEEDVDYLQNETAEENEHTSENHMKPYKKKGPKKSSSNNKTTYRNYTKINLEKSLDAVRSGRMSRAKAAIFYGVPRNTIAAYLRKEIAKYGGFSGAITTNEKYEKEAARYGVPAEEYKRKDNKFSCVRCGAEYSIKLFMINHIRTKHLNMEPIPRKKCKYCKKVFLSCSMVMQHILEDHGIDDRYECKACDSKYLTQEGLKMHMDNYHKLGGKIFSCELCDYETYLANELNKHMVRHVQVKEFPCRFCKKSFPRKKSLVVHEKIHTGEKRHVCMACGEAFVQSNSLIYHNRKYHSDANF